MCVPIRQPADTGLILRLRRRLKFAIGRSFKSLIRQWADIGAHHQSTILKGSLGLHGLVALYYVSDIDVIEAVDVQTALIT